MELRQLRSFVRVVELNSMGRAALELNIATSTVSQQISQLESELSTRLLQRRSTGVFPTDAGLDFWHQAQAILRQVELAAAVAQQGRLSGQVSVGLAASTAGVIVLPLLQIMRERYPTVRVRIVEGLTSHLGTLLNSRQLDLAMLFEVDGGRRWSVIPLVEEQLFVIGRPDILKLPALADDTEIRAADLGDLPLILPGSSHKLRALVTAGFNAIGLEPNVVLEVDGAHSVMNAVRAGLGATIQPGALVSALGLAHEVKSSGVGLRALPIADSSMRRRCILASLSDDELSPAGLATRVVLTQLARDLVNEKQWRGASII